MPGQASHAKPWRTSSDQERLDPHNGLPLIATLGVLFDRGLIGFADAMSSSNYALMPMRSVGIFIPRKTALHRKR